MTRVETTNGLIPGRLRQSGAWLVAGNCLPLLGVLFLGWDVGALVVFYWSENLVIGAYNLLKMAAVGGVKALLPGFFFLIHYGGFCAAHGFFILSMLLDVPATLGEATWPLFLVFLQMLLQVIGQVLANAPPAWLLAFLGIFLGLLVTHGYSFVTNFLLGGERRRETIASLMAAPYRRIVVLHVAVIAGGFGVAALGEPLVLLIALVVLKTFADLALHRREHRLPVNIDSENMAAR